MKAKIAAIGVTLLLVTAGAAAAAPGNAPDVSNADESDGEYDGEAEEFPADDARDDDESEEMETEPADDAESENAGPPADMPGQVPDHVTEIHETVNDYIDDAPGGSLGSIPSGIDR